MLLMDQRCAHTKVSPSQNEECLLFLIDADPVYFMGFHRVSASKQGHEADGEQRSEEADAFYVN